MRVIGLMRVKNEERWIERAVTSMQPVCERIIVLDDHSTDETPAICERLGCTVLPNPGTRLDETVDKNFLLHYAGQFSPDFCLMLDGDEALAPNAVTAIRVVTQQPRPVAFSFRIAYLWDSENRVRTDGVYSRFRRPSLWGYQPGQRFKTTGNGGNFHCGSVPEGLTTFQLEATILHYGYMLREDRIRKYEFYNRIDPNDRAEDFYRHMVVGDLFPASARFQWGGPLKLEALNGKP